MLLLLRACREVDAECSSKCKLQSTHVPQQPREAHTGCICLHVMSCLSSCFFSRYGQTSVDLSTCIWPSEHYDPLSLLKLLVLELNSLLTGRIQRIVMSLNTIELVRCVHMK